MKQEIRTLLTLAILSVVTLVVIVGIQRGSTAQQTEPGARASNTPDTKRQKTPQKAKEEAAAVSLISRNRADLSDPVGIRDALRQLEEISKLRKIESIETMRAVADYLDVSDRLLDPSFRPHKGYAIEVPEEENNPAVRILGYIGKPGLGVLLEVLESNEASSVKFHNALLLVKSSFGSDWDDAVVYLREKAELARTESGRQNLLIAADKIARNVP